MKRVLTIAYAFYFLISVALDFSNDSLSNCLLFYHKWYCTFQVNVAVFPNTGIILS